MLPKTLALALTLTLPKYPLYTLGLIPITKLEIKMGLKISVV